MEVERQMPGPSNGPTRVLLTRHGQTVANKEGRFCGHSETPLTDFGRLQARALAQRLAATPIHAAYSSDFSRAMDTAATVLEGRDISLRLDSALREIHYGAWEMVREREIAKLDPLQYRLMRAEDPAWQPPGGETVGMVRERTHAAFQRIVAAHKHQTVFVTMHGDAIICLIAELLRVPLDQTYRFEIANCSLSEVVVRGGRVTLAGLNDTAHLAGLAKT